MVPFLTSSPSHNVKTSPLSKLKYIRLQFSHSALDIISLIWTEFCVLLSNFVRGLWRPCKLRPLFQWVRQLHLVVWSLHYSHWCYSIYHWWMLLKTILNFPGYYGLFSKFLFCLSSSLKPKEMYFYHIWQRKDIKTSLLQSWNPSKLGSWKTTVNSDYTWLIRSRLQYLNSHQSG